MPLWKKKKPKKRSVNKPKPKPKQALSPVLAKPKFEPKPFVPPKTPEYFTPPAMPTRPPEKKATSKRQAVDVENEFLKTFKSLTYRHRGWDIWNDFIVMAACALSNPVDKSHYEERERRYLRIIKKYDKEEQNKFPTLFAHTVMALEFNPEQDFLGKLYTRLGLQDEGRKQHFTPYSICQVMADITMTDIVKQVRENGYITLNDPCCGAGATLIAGINCAKRRLGEACLNFQNHFDLSNEECSTGFHFFCTIEEARSY